MFANPLFFYSCGHIAPNFALGETLNGKQTKICPRCLKGALNTVEYDCELCGEPARTTASGFERSQRLFCAECRKTYNSWDCMARKAKNSRRNFPALDDYVAMRRHKKPNAKDVMRDPEPPLTTQEFHDIAKFGKRASPCAQCANITRDKNEAPCNACPQLAFYSQTQDKLFLDVLYI